MSRRLIARASIAATLFAALAFAAHAMAQPASDPQPAPAQPTPAQPVPAQPTPTPTDSTPTPTPTEPAPTPTAGEPSAVQPPPSDELPTRVRDVAAPADMSDQAIGAELGVAVGGRVTPGGLRVAGHYLYQLAGTDWFDGVAAFTFGGGTAACFRDRMDTYICEHGLAQGDAFEVQANVRHFFGNASGDGKFYPYVRGGIGIGYARFGGDSVSGLIIPLHLAGGVRASVSPTVAITAELELAIGFGAFNHTLGLEPQLGTDLIAGVEFKL